MNAPALVNGLAVAILAVCHLPGDALRSCEEQIRARALSVHFDEAADDCTPEGNALLAVAEAIDLFLFDRDAPDFGEVLPGVRLVAYSAAFLLFDAADGPDWSEGDAGRFSLYEREGEGLGGLVAEFDTYSEGTSALADA